MLVQIKHHWSGRIIFEAEVECEASASAGVRLGLAVRLAYGRGAVLRGADLRGADLRDADLSGAVLSVAVLSVAVLSDADLRGADLRDANLRGADLRDANLRGADLSGAVLRDAVLSGAVLRDAVLSGAVLRDADLSGAVLSGALDWVPKIPDIHQSVYAAASAPGALNMGNWHICETTHCRAGWVTHLAGDAGRVMDAMMGTDAAAALIYVASDPTLEKVPDFYCSNDAALADMKRLAEEEVARAQVSA
jgi:hypothetical protein